MPSAHDLCQCKKWLLRLVEFALDKGREVRHCPIGGVLLRKHDLPLIFTYMAMGKTSYLLRTDSKRYRSGGWNG